MAEMEAKFYSKAADKFFKKLIKNSKAITDGQKKYLVTLGAVVYKDIIRHFEKEKDPNGGWEEWSDIYAEHMAKIGKGGNKILQDKGRLRNSFTPTSFQKQSGGVVWFNPAKTGEGFPYAYAHDEGGPKLPERKFMWLSENALETMGVKTLRFILDN